MIWMALFIIGLLVMAYDSASKDQECLENPDTTTVYCPE